MTVDDQAHDILAIIGGPGVYDFPNRSSYWFFYTNEQGQQAQWRFPTFAEATKAAVKNDAEQIWFMDAHGNHHATMPIYGQERF